MTGADATGDVGRGLPELHRRRRPDLRIRRRHPSGRRRPGRALQRLLRQVGGASRRYRDRFQGYFPPTAHAGVRPRASVALPVRRLRRVPQRDVLQRGARRPVRGAGSPCHRRSGDEAPGDPSGAARDRGLVHGCHGGSPHRAQALARPASSPSGPTSTWTWWPPSADAGTRWPSSRPTEIRRRRPTTRSPGGYGRSCPTPARSSGCQGCSCRSAATTPACTSEQVLPLVEEWRSLGAVRLPWTCAPRAGTPATTPPAPCCWMPPLPSWKDGCRTPASTRATPATQDTHPDTAPSPGRDGDSGCARACGAIGTQAGRPAEVELPTSDRFAVASS